MLSLGEMYVLLIKKKTTTLETNNETIPKEILFLWWILGKQRCLINNTMTVAPNPTDV